MEKGSEGRTLPIICVTNRKLCTIPFMEQLEKIAQSGVSRIILREKDLSEEAYIQLAKPFVNLCQSYHVEGTLHSYGNTPLWSGAESLHFSMEGLRCWKKEHPKITLKHLGASVHSAAEGREAEKLGADYIIAGHVFPTDCKRGIPGRGAEFLREVSGAVSIPVYAIGGIHAANLREIRNCGIAGVCIMSSLMKTQSPKSLIASLQTAWDQNSKESGLKQKEVLD